ncbi:hypothetical protein AAG570_002719 [Ranatra chinensis]|uniref:Uncharacterized protein n=1 Tax=Ranatra chinensis TaxID=642074 RepID=A0ABD0YR47_9HEMI
MVRRCGIPESSFVEGADLCSYGQGRMIDTACKKPKCMPGARALTWTTVGGQCTRSICSSGVALYDRLTSSAFWGDLDDPTVTFRCTFALLVYPRLLRTAHPTTPVHHRVRAPQELSGMSINMPISSSGDVSNVQDITASRVRILSPVAQRGNRLGFPGRGEKSRTFSYVGPVERICVDPTHTIILKFNSA